MNLRRAMNSIVSKMIKKEPDTALFLVDIGVWNFQEILKDYSERVYNVGIFEDGMISVAAGFALRGLIPTIYGISPFIVERALEQIKLDFAYQKLQGNLITTGASYDYSTLGYSHYCPEDLNVLKSIPGVEFVAPGSPQEFERLFDAAHSNGNITYFRCSDHCNNHSIPVEFGKANVIKRGTKATVIAVATTLDIVLKACSDYDVGILYYTTLEPFDYSTLAECYNNGKILIVHPFYLGSFHYDICRAFDGKNVTIKEIGNKREIYRNYGTKEENDVFSGFTCENIESMLKGLLCDY